MTSLSEKALKILQANEKKEFTNSDLVKNGFSEATAKLAIKELEDEGYIEIRTTYINGNSSFQLL